MTDQTINNNYLAGFLHVTLKDLPSAIVREGVVGWGSPAHKAIERLVEKELQRVFEAERTFSQR
jgi:hypothetical protein